MNDQPLTGWPLTAFWISVCGACLLIDLAAAHLFIRLLEAIQ